MVLQLKLGEGWYFITWELHKIQISVSETLVLLVSPHTQLQLQRHHGS